MEQRRITRQPLQHGVDAEPRHVNVIRRRARTSRRKQRHVRRRLPPFAGWPAPERALRIGGSNGDKRDGEGPRQYPRQSDLRVILARCIWRTSSPNPASARRIRRVSMCAPLTASTRGRTSPSSRARTSCSSIPTSASVLARAFRRAPWKRFSPSTRRRKSGRTSSTSTRSISVSNSPSNDRGRPASTPWEGSEPMMRWTSRFVLCAAALVAGSLVLQADDKIAAGDAQLQFQLGNLLSDETRFREALDAYDKAIQADDKDLQVRARAGKVKTALRIAEFDLAQKEGELLRASAPSDPEAMSLYADSLWSGGLFDEAEDAYRQALALNKESSRARFGLARSLATRSKLQEALVEAQATSAMSPRDGEIHAEIGEIYQQIGRASCRERV